jgi:hypothetical protein
VGVQAVQPAVGQRARIEHGVPCARATNLGAHLLSVALWSAAKHAQHSLCTARTKAHLGAPCDRQRESTPARGLW